jgi:hypothetical protein
MTDITISKEEYDLLMKYKARIEKINATQREAMKLYYSKNKNKLQDKNREKSRALYQDKLKFDEDYKAKKRDYENNKRLKIKELITRVEQLEEERTKSVSI